MSTRPSGSVKKTSSNNLNRQIGTRMPSGHQGLSQVLLGCNKISRQLLSTLKLAIGAVNCLAVTYEP